MEITGKISTIVNEYGPYKKNGNTTEAYEQQIY